MAMIAKKCSHASVTVVDLNESRIGAWNSDELPVYEPGLLEIVQAARQKPVLQHRIERKSVREAEVIFISVNTPTKQYGSGAGQAADLRFVESCARMIAEVGEGIRLWLRNQPCRSERPKW